MKLDRMRQHSTGLFVAMGLLTTGLMMPAHALAQSDPLDADTKTINVEIVMDASGSMAEGLEGSTRMEVAKGVLHDMIGQIPQKDGVNVGFRVYGHKGNNTEAARAESCAATELLVPMEGVNTELLNTSVDSFQPTGWTPIALSLEEAGKDFESGESVTNAIVLVTDGEETCGGDPAAVAAELNAGGVSVTTHVIGFATTPQDQASLEGIAEAGGGSIYGAADGEELNTALFSVLEELEVVPTQSTPSEGGVVTDPAQACLNVAPGTESTMIIGGEEANVIAGTEGPDLLVGGSGNDVICGFGGDDGLSGGAGDDVIIGGDGLDTLTGDEGNDFLFGEAGNDMLIGVNGADTLHGGVGDDVLTGGVDNDTSNGEDGADTCSQDQGETVSNCEIVVPETGS